MKDWNMIHKIKALYNEGNGLNISQIARELNITRNTVRKYLQMCSGDISDYQENTERAKKLDRYEAYIVHLLQTFPKLSAKKVMKKLEKKFGNLSLSERTVRRFVEDLKKTTPIIQERYYEPVLDDVPGAQCQIDPGEVRGVKVGDEILNLYFVVFVLSYSRLMYTSISFKPINTEIFIRMHDDAFRYFGGVTEECVYDQTKMVIISEEFREVKVNQQFLEYATTVEFRIRACEGYDPESKGKVESGVKYVKNNCLYGEEFSSREHLLEHVKEWLEETANARIHGTTNRQPREFYELEEKARMEAYLSPERILNKSSEEVKKRHVDKTGLLSWQGNKYSVPMYYQRSYVGVQEEGQQIFLFDLSTKEKIGFHAVCYEKGRIFKKPQHYRDQEARILKLETEICGIIGEQFGKALCTLLKKTNPGIYKDQLFGAVKLLKQHYPFLKKDMQRLIERERLSATGLRDFLEAMMTKNNSELENASSSVVPIGLKSYAGITDSVSAGGDNG
jgi:transposase